MFRFLANAFSLRSSVRSVRNSRRPRLECLEDRLTPSTLFVDDNKVQDPKAKYTSIQAAINAAHAGDDIRVYPGTYAEQLTIGAGKNGLEIEAATGTAPVVTAPATLTGNAAVINISASQNVRIENLSIQGNASTEFGIRVDTGASADLDDNTISSILGANGAGIFVGQSMPPLRIRHLLGHVRTSTTTRSRTTARPASRSTAPSIPPTSTATPSSAAATTRRSPRTASRSPTARMATSNATTSAAIATPAPSAPASTRPASCFPAPAAAPTSNGTRSTPTRMGSSDLRVEGDRSRRQRQRQEHRRRHQHRRFVEHGRPLRPDLPERRRRHQRLRHARTRPIRASATSSPTSAPTATPAPASTSSRRRSSPCSATRPTTTPATASC